MSARHRTRDHLQLSRIHTFASAVDRPDGSYRPKYQLIKCGVEIDLPSTRLCFLGFDYLCDSRHRFRRLFVFPDAHDFPPGSLEPIVGVSVAELVFSDFVVPEACGGTFRGSMMFGAPVPKAAVEKYREIGRAHV